jgi:hypothetical protein
MFGWMSLVWWVPRYELTEEEVAKIAIPALREAQTTLLVVDVCTVY